MHTANGDGGRLTAVARQWQVRLTRGEVSEQVMAGAAQAGVMMMAYGEEQLAQDLERRLRVKEGLLQKLSSACVLQLALLARATGCIEQFNRIEGCVNPANRRLVGMLRLSARLVNEVQRRDAPDESGPVRIAEVMSEALLLAEGTHPQQDGVDPKAAMALLADEIRRSVDVEPKLAHWMAKAAEVTPASTPSRTPRPAVQRPPENEDPLARRTRMEIERTTQGAPQEAGGAQPGPRPPRQRRSWR